MGVGGGGVCVYGFEGISNWYFSGVCWDKVDGEKKKILTSIQVYEPYFFLLKIFSCVNKW